jgi:hypothetical protein
MKVLVSGLEVTFRITPAEAQAPDLAAERAASISAAIAAADERRLMFGTPSAAGLAGLLSPTPRRPRPPNELQRRILDLLAKQPRAGDWMATTAIAERIGAPLPAVAAALVALRSRRSVMSAPARAGRGTAWAVPIAGTLAELAESAPGSSMVTCEGWRPQ